MRRRGTKRMSAAAVSSILHRQQKLPSDAPSLGPLLSFPIRWDDYEEDPDRDTHQDLKVEAPPLPLLPPFGTKSTLKPTCKVHGYKVFSHTRSVFGRSKSEIVRSARFYGQFSYDKTWTLQAGSSVVPLRSNHQSSISTSPSSVR